EILEIVKEADDRVNFGGGWHSDFSFKTRPPAGTILQAIEVPPSGGDTLFSNQCLAYETLSAGMREMLDGLNAVHSPVRSYSHDAVARKPRLGMTVVADDSAYERHVHPLIRVHPVTGRRSLFCNPTYTVGIEGWTEVESAPLLEQLNRHATRPELTCRVQWAPGTVTMWDNRCCQHNALNDYHGHRRHMRRATVVGEVPLAA
ncbi:MAG: TauD/TfdA family dioxygenase, partial [Gammaproteobacteria bacterium]|nr:TauD/TfdA family dioxygenase [Gammaproteobacteria bacterium]